MIFVLAHFSYMHIKIVYLIHNTMYITEVNETCFIFPLSCVVP
jgi:hypothetical protein